MENCANQTTINTEIVDTNTETINPAQVQEEPKEKIPLFWRVYKIIGYIVGVIAILAVIQHVIEVFTAPKDPIQLVQNTYYYYDDDDDKKTPTIGEFINSISTAKDVKWSTYRNDADTADIVYLTYTDTEWYYAPTDNSTTTREAFIKYTWEIYDDYAHDCTVEIEDEYDNKYNPFVGDSYLIRTMVDSIKE